MTLDSPEALDAPDRVADRAATWACWVATTATLVSILGAAVTAIAHHWVPIGDHAIFAARAGDVFTTRTPLLGTWTSASLATHQNFNNPGPLYYDLLAIPARVFGIAGAGVAVGTALINAVSALGVVVVARRQGGNLAGALAATTTAVLAWTLGSEVLVESTQPGALVFPVLLAMFLAWAVANGDLALVPWFVVAASVVLQTYITYIYLIGAFAAWCVYRLLRGRRPGTRKFAIIAFVVAFVLWLPPLLQQFVGDGPPNLTNLVRAAQHPGTPIGYRAGTRIVAQVLTVAPWWFRPGWGELLNTLHPQPTISLPVAVVLLALLAAALVAVAWFARRRDRMGTAAVVTAIVALVAGLFTGTRIPFGVFGASSHVYRWLWPLAAFITFAVALVAARRLAARNATPIVAGLLTAVAVVVSIANLPSTDQGRSNQLGAIPTLRDLGAQLRRADLPHTVRIDLASANFADPYSTGLFAQLETSDVHWCITDEGALFQVGFARRCRTNVSTLTIREGDSVLDAVTPGERVAVHYALRDDEVAEMNALEQDLTARFAPGSLVLNDRGRRAVAAGRVALPGGFAMFDARSYVRSDDFHMLVRDRDVVLDPATRRRIIRYADLRDRWMLGTAAVYLVSGG